jgi:hypothetical protein
MKVLQKDSKGEAVKQWQSFLRGQGYKVDVTGEFDDNTVKNTKRFQRKYNLEKVDGIVGNKTLGQAASLGFQLVDYSGTDLGYPPKPNFRPLVSNASRQNKFGPLEFVPAPSSNNPEKIKITNNWDRDYLVKVTIPQLVGIKGANQSRTLRFHKKAAEQLKELWREWEERQLLQYVLTFDGAYSPRFVRGAAQRQSLSNHAFGTAFDINCQWNRFGAQPSTSNSNGNLYKLVPVANEFGFYWGGHFSRKDGMHFEIAKIR